MNSDQLALLNAQTQTMAIMSSSLRTLSEEKTKLAEEVERLKKGVNARDARITVLEGYFSQMGFRLPVIESNILWFNGALKTMDIKVAPEKIVNDLSFADDRQRDYVATLARAIIA